jgi:DNA-binding IscR family transcriptional regulator
MQKLRDHNLIASTHGTKGGYVLIRDLGQVSLADYLAAMEGDIDVVDCCRHQEMGPSVDRCKNSFNGHRGGEAQTTKACPYMENCNIREPMVALNSKMSLFLKTVSLAELLEP